MKIQILIILLIAIADLSSSNPSKCARIPDGTGSNKSPPDGRFRLRIINDPVRYIPGETYKSKYQKSGINILVEMFQKMRRI